VHNTRGGQERNSGRAVALILLRCGTAPSYDAAACASKPRFEERGYCEQVAGRRRGARSDPAREMAVANAAPLEEGSV